MPEHVVHADVHRPAGQIQSRLGLLRHGLGLAAAQPRRKAFGGLEQTAIRTAQADREQPLVLRGALEQRPESRDVAARHRGGDRVRQRIGQQRAAAVQIAAEPAQRDLVEQRHRERGGDDQRHHQRQQEAQLQPQRAQRWPARVRRLDNGGHGQRSYLIGIFGRI